MNVCGWPVVSSKAKGVFESSCINGVEFLPIRIVDISGTHINNNDYYLLYTSNFIDAYDMDKSDYRYIERYNIYSFNPMKIVFDDNACKKFDIFRCIKDITPLYISSRLHDIIIMNQLTGFDYVAMT